MLTFLACVAMLCVRLMDYMSGESLRVFLYGWLTCVTTGLGALPFMFVGAEAFGERSLALANSVASGMMLAASAGMLLEAHEHCGKMDWQILVGSVIGMVFIKASEVLHGSSGSEEAEEDGIVTLHCALMEKRYFRKALLIFVVMFCHSAAEGVAVGVAFSQYLGPQFGVFIAFLLAVHNVPEGLAVALVLVPRGVSPAWATAVAILTSVPQPFLAVAAFRFVDTFRGFLPLGLAFAAGAMVYVCLHELLMEAADILGWGRALVAMTASFVFMSLAIVVLQSLTGS